MVQKNSTIRWGLFFLRLGLCIFLILGAINKIIAPEETIQFFSQFYLLEIDSSMSMIIGSCELALSLFIILGIYKTISYGLALSLHTISTIIIFQHILLPFGKNQFFIAALPILFAFIALFLLRELDTKLNLSRKKSIFT